MKYFVIFLVLIGIVGTAFAESPVDKDLTNLAELWCTGNRSEDKLIDFLGNFSYIDPKYHNTFFQEKFAEELLMRTPELMVYGSDDAFFITQKGDAALSCPPIISFEGSFQTSNGKRYEFTIWHDSAKIYDYEIKDLVFPKPRQQLNAGIELGEIACKAEFILIQKYEGSPACVKYGTGVKLLERGWGVCSENISYGRENPCGPRSSEVVSFESESDSLILKENQTWGYIKNISILENNYINITMSYPTNEASHEMYPDEYQSIVGNCSEQGNSASLSLLYLKEIEEEKDQITFTKEIKTFDGFQCEDAFWQEMTRWGYCGPPSSLIFDTENLVSSIDDAQKKTDLILDVPRYLPDGYSIQKITVEPDGESVMLYASPKPVTNEMSGCDFAWDDEGIFLLYTKPSQNFDWDAKYVKYAEDPKKQLVTINDNPGYAENHWVGDRFGMPIPQQSKIVFYINADDKIIEIHSSLATDELIKVAKSFFAEQEN